MNGTKPAEVRIVSTEFGYAPAKVMVIAGRAVTLVLDNSGAETEHGLFVPAFDFRLQAKETARSALFDRPLGFGGTAKKYTGGPILPALFQRSEPMFRAYIFKSFGDADVLSAGRSASRSFMHALVRHPRLESGKSGSTALTSRQLRRHILEKFNIAFH